MKVYRTAEGLRKTLFLGIILLGLGQGLFSQDMKTDFTNPQEAPLVTRGDFVLRGSVLVSYTGNAAKVVIPGNLGITEIADNALSSNSITSVTIPEGVKTLGYAFGDNYSLQEIRLPASLIGDYDFTECWSLTSIEVDGRNPQYASAGGVLFTKDRTALIRYPAGKQDPAYTIPNTVKSIGYGAFSGCRLTSVVIPNSVSSIGDSAFSRCRLTSVVIPNSVSSIGNYAFSSCRSLTSVVIPNSVSSIGDSAFRWCSSLTSVVIPNSVNTIGNSAFSDCEKLTSVVIPNSVSSIGNYAFSGCSSLTSVVIPNSVSSIGDSAFSDCRSLTSIEVDGRNPQYASIGGVLFTKDRTTLIQYPQGKQDPAYTIPNTVKSIGNYAFSYCWSLTSVVIPNSVNTIGNYAFSYCWSLTSVVIPNSVSSIGNSAFYYCSSLTSVVMPGNINVGRYNGFDGAYNQNGKKAGTYTKNGNAWGYTP